MPNDEIIVVRYFRCVDNERRAMVGLAYAHAHAYNIDKVEPFVILVNGQIHSRVRELQDLYPNYNVEYRDDSGLSYQTSCGA